MVTSRTLLAGGLAVIAIIALASVVVLQQVAISQLRSQTMYVTIPMIYSVTGTMLVTQTVTQTVTPQIGSTTTPIMSGTPYVLITYSAQTMNSIGFSTPVTGNTFLAVYVKAENHGYDRVYVYRADFYVIVGSQQFQYSSSTFSLSNYLPSTDVFNGLSVAGYVVYEVPANYGTFTLFWDHPSNVNVQYVHQ